MQILQSEEQRAYIEMLKNTIDDKIRKVGIDFCGGGVGNYQRNVDGLMHLLEL